MNKVYHVIILFMLFSACQHNDLIELNQPIIKIKDKNIYSLLEQSNDKQICIKGKLDVNIGGVNFPLSELESEGIINFGYSKIESGISVNDSIRFGLKDRKTYKICGVLKEITPQKTCKWNDCRQFILKDSYFTGYL